jgi:hypothetical protein
MVLTEGYLFSLSDVFEFPLKIYVFRISILLILEGSYYNSSYYLILRGQLFKHFELLNETLPEHGDSRNELSPKNGES